MEAQTSEEEKKLSIILAEHNCYPVFADKKLVENFTKFYDYIINPIFHNFNPCSDGLEEDSKELLNAYKTINQIFVKRILDLCQSESIVLFNDGYFLLAPKMLVDKQPNITLGYFMHSPFPSYDIYRQLPFAEKYLKSILCCDLVGFHLYEYARHFFTSCQRILSLQTQAR